MPPRKVRRIDVTPPLAAGAPWTPAPGQNPLLLEVVANHVLSFVHSPDDQNACSAVCVLWRRLGARRTQPTVVVQDDFNDAEDSAYLAFIRPPEGQAFPEVIPVVKATRFSFENTNLTAPAVQELLTLNGSDIEELELRYSFYDDDDDKGQLTFSNFGRLLLVQAPNLKTLIIQEMPSSMCSDADDALVPAQLGLDNTARTLNLTTITLIPPCLLDDDFGLLDSLLIASPHLSHVQLLGDPRGPFATKQSHSAILGLLVTRMAEEVPEALACTGRLAGVKWLQLHQMTPTSLQILAQHLVPAQLLRLEVFSVGVDYKRARSHATGGGPRTPLFSSESVRRLLIGQSGSLERLDWPLSGWSQYWPCMPNLVELRLCACRAAFEDLEQPLNLHFNYATNFPKLRLLGVEGSVESWGQDAIYPPDSPAVESVKVLQEVPSDVDQALMGRIGRLFPNLSIIRTWIQFGDEELLVGLWTGCPGLVELFLTLSGNRERYNRGAKELTGTERRSLDSIFSGISESECGRLRELTPGQLKMAALEMLRGPSLLHLKKLRRLCIDGPSFTLRGPHYGNRDDRLTDIFGVTTLVPFVASEEFRIVQVGRGVAGLGRATIRMATTSAGAAGVQLVSKKMAGYDEDFVRLIRSGFGYEAMGAVPDSWYGA